MKEGQEAGQGYPALTQESLSKFSASLKKTPALLFSFIQSTWEAWLIICHNSI